MVRNGPLMFSEILNKKLFVEMEFQIEIKNL